MKYTLECVERDTGRDRVVTIEAQNQQDAERIASQRGLLVATAKADPSAKTINYQSPISPSLTPEYSGLKRGESLLSGFAMVYYLGAMLGIAAVVTMLIANPNYTAQERIYVCTVGASAAVGLAMFGVIMNAAASACSALRDIAINSFR